MKTSLFSGALLIINSIMCAMDHKETVQCAKALVELQQKNDNKNCSQSLDKKPILEPNKSDSQKGEKIEPRQSTASKNILQETYYD